VTVNKSLVIGVIAVVAVFAGVFYLVREEPETGKSPPAAKAADHAAKPATGATKPELTSRSDPAARPTPPDPRVAALMVSPPDALIEFVSGADGKVIKEIDNDPNSAGYRKPLREYTWSGDKMVGLTRYRYSGDEVQIVRIAISYYPDGNVEHYRETTSYEYPDRANKG
jgi:hypothetical protein